MLSDAGPGLHGLDITKTDTMCRTAVFHVVKSLKTIYLAHSHNLNPLLTIIVEILTASKHREHMQTTNVRSDQYVHSSSMI